MEKVRNGRNAYLGLAAAVGLALAAPAQATELCDQVKAFVQAPLAKGSDGKPVRRWVELHWVGVWMDVDHGWTRTCKQAEDASSHALCGWLVNNSPFEFADTLPKDIMKCFGYGFPRPNDTWFPWVATMTFKHGSPDDRFVVLETDFRNRKSTESAMRLSVVPFGEDHDESSSGPMIDPVVNPPVE
jgi:hypothetical protein